MHERCRPVRAFCVCVCAYGYGGGGDQSLNQEDIGRLRVEVGIEVVDCCKVAVGVVARIGGSEGIESLGGRVVVAATEGVSLLRRKGGSARV